MRRRTPPPSTRRVLLFALPALLAGLGLLAAAPAVAQQPPPAEEAITVETLPSHGIDELRSLFDRALAVFHSADQPESEELFTQLIDMLGEPASEAADERRQLLVRSLASRAEVRFNLGELEAARSDLRETLAVDPGYEPDLSLISPKLAELFRTVQAEVVGTLSVQLDPSDAELSLDGAPAPRLAAGEPVRLPAGSYHLAARRPGYAPAEVDVELAAGADERRTLALERTSATLRVTTAQPGAEVVVDGRSYGVTALPSTAAPGEPAAAAGPALLFVEGLASGDHTFELRRQGFRSHQGNLRITDLSDYRVGPITLQATGGAVVLVGLPPRAEVRVDGETRTPPRDASGRPRLDLAVGGHRIAVSAGTLGGFETAVDLADRQVLEVPVELVPSLCLVGVLGGDADAAERVRSGLPVAFSTRGSWLFLDREEDGAAVLAPFSLRAQTLRGAAPGGTAAAAIDWAGMQRGADRALACSAYGLAVLSDDLYAAAADLWVFPAAPGPPRADVLRLRLADPTSFREAAGRFAEPPALTTAWLGADLLPTESEAGPVVLRVTEGGPAAKAGLRPGDVVVSAGGSADPAAALAAAGPGAPLPLTYERAGARHQVTVQLGTSPRIIDPASSGLFLPAASSWWSLATASGDAASPAWVVDLNRAAAQLGLADWIGAVRTLRGIQVPERSGLGRGTVDYWLGLALLATDPTAYRDEARAAFDRAAASPARLFDDDGPRVAPRAQARLRAMTVR